MNRNKQSSKHLQATVDHFNEKVKVGDKVQAKSDEYADWETVTVSAPASILGGHSAVVWFKEKRGCYSLNFVKY